VISTALAQDFRSFSTDKCLCHNGLRLTRLVARSTVLSDSQISMKRQGHTASQILLFPARGEAAEERYIDLAAPASLVGVAPNAPIIPETAQIVLSGSFRKDLAGLSREFEELQDLGFRILSPANTKAVSEEDGFVFMEGEESAAPEAIELRHLDAIRRSAFVWLHAPEGYVGPSAALEVGFARASGIPVYSRVAPTDKVLQNLVQTVSSPSELVTALRVHPVPPLPAVQSFQSYYAHAAVRRGYQKESPQDTLLMMLEEFGELARAVRKRQKLRRDSKGRVGQAEHELADIFIYVVHMANVLGVDLGEAVHKKEQINIQRFLTR
jgi:NTP pyrophosphatase (non-canonical NTP hydrolase)